MRAPIRRLVLLAGALAVLFGAYAVIARPWFSRWGATDAEVRAALPGDDIVSEARSNATVTRAITIAAPITAVWPWLAQLGQDRGGFYSYELLEDLAGCRMENTDRIHPEYQRWNAGDKLWMYPPEKIGGMGHAKLVVLEPGRALGFATRQIGTPGDAPYNGSWSFVLVPRGDRATRLLVRGRAGGHRSLRALAFDRLVFEPIHFVMERKMLKGVALRAEGRRDPESLDVAQVVLWTITFGLFIASAALVLLGARWMRALWVFVITGFAFQLLTFVQPPPQIGAVVVGALAAWIAWPPTPAAPPAAPAIRRVGWHFETVKP